MPLNWLRRAILQPSSTNVLQVLSFVKSYLAWLGGSMIRLGFAPLRSAALHPVKNEAFNLLGLASVQRSKFARGVDASRLDRFVRPGYLEGA